MFSNAVYTNQSREGEYRLREQRGEMRNLKKKLLSFQNPHCNLLLPLFECFLGAFILLLPTPYYPLFSFSRKTSFL